MILGRRKTPTIIQMESAEGGAAALAIILGYYKKYVPLVELRYHCGVTRDGCSPESLIEAARFYGLEATEVTADLQELPLPVILYLKNKHFIVLEGFSRNSFAINDPAVGPKRLTEKELLQEYSGIAFLLRPGAGFKKGPPPPAFIPMILERIKTIPLAGWLFLLALQLCAILVALILPSFSRFFIDDFLGRHLWEWKTPFFVALFIIFILQAWSGIVGIAYIRIRRKFAYDFSTQFLDHILKLPILYFLQRQGAEIIQRMSLNQSISHVLTGQLAPTIINLFLIAIYGFVIFQYDALIATLGIIAALINIGMFAAISRARSNNYNRIKQESAKSIGVAVDTLQNIESVKMMGNDSFSFMRVLGYLTKNLNNLQEISQKDVWLTQGALFVNNLANIGLLGLGCWRVMEGHLTIGMLLALQMLMQLFLAPVNQMIQFSMQLQTLKIELQRVNDVLKHPIDSYLRGSGEEITGKELTGAVEMQEISFGYNPLKPPLIEDFNLKIAAGESVALVGVTGSGKSTISKLLCGILKPWSGEIYYDGIPIENLTRNQLKSVLSWVDQDIFLFSGTIRDNLSLWNPSITIERMIEAAKDACINDEILNKENGYVTFLQEGGGNLSQGQKQRLEIARALLMDPKILILDEATSSLDTRTEQLIIQNIKNRKITTLLVAHRLSSIKMCDRIIVMKDGKVVQVGTHEELKMTPGLYKELVNVYSKRE